MYQYQEQPPYAQPPYQAGPPPPSMNGGGYPGYPPQQPAYGAPPPPQQPPYGSYGQPSAPPARPAAYYGSPPAASTSYGSPRYPPPQHQPSPAYTPPPPPQAQLSPQPYNLGVDPNVFQGYYSHELRGLTFNSKPIINGLTILAQEHAGRMAPVVAQCLEDHIRQTHASTKLPSLYLLDSICKNVGQPYTTLFASTIDRILLSAYYEVDAQTRTKLEELVGTWRNGGPDRRELFPLPPDAPPGTRPAQQVIEETIWGRPSQPPVPSYPSNGMHHPQHLASMSPPPPLHLPVMPQAAPIAYHHPQPQPRPPTPPQASPASANAAEKAAVLFDLRKLLALRREQALGNPADKNNAGQIVTLQALEQLVLNSQLGSAQVGQIRDQLARLAPAQPPRLATPPIVPKIESEEDDYNRGFKRQRLMSPSQAMRGTPPITGPINPALASLTSLLNPNIIRTASAQGIRASATPPPAFAQIPTSQLPTPVLAPANLPGLNGRTANPALADALANLDPKLLATFTGAAQATNDAVALARIKETNERALAAYEHHRLHFRVQLQNSDIARYRPGSSALIHEAMPLGCKQCGNRYLDSPSGKDRLAKDLDRHLRISRRYTEGIGAQRAVGRSWFALEEEWVLPPSAIQPSAAVVRTEQDKKVAADKAQMINQTVRVPEGAATNEEISKCPICKEAFKNEYSESEEDWVWRNAIELDGKFYHASCKAEQGGDD